jgi:hypothetical protein
LDVGSCASAREVRQVEANAFKVLNERNEHMSDNTDMGTDSMPRPFPHLRPKKQKTKNPLMLALNTGPSKKKNLLGP